MRRNTENSPVIKTSARRTTVLLITSRAEAVFPFCICPGGFVVAAASEQGGIAVNGMSENSRNGENSNSAIVAQITPEDLTAFSAEWNFSENASVRRMTLRVHIQLRHKIPLIL